MTYAPASYTYAAVDVPRIRYKSVVDYLLFSPIIESVTMTLYYLRDCFAGFTRYYLALHGADVLWFLPDAASFVCMLLFIVRYIFVGRSSAAIFVMLYLIFSVIMSAIFFRDYLAVASSIKMFLPAFVGFCFCARPLHEMKSIQFLLWTVFLATCFGIAWNYFAKLPWEGYAYYGIGVGDRSAGKIWWQGGERRLGGFAADSTMAGFFVMASFAIIALRLGLFLRIAIGLAAAGLAWLATSKTNSAATLIILAILAFTWFLGTSREHLILKKVARLSYITIFTPFLLMLTLNGANLASYNSLLYSMQDRINNSWVKPFIYIGDQFTPGFLSGCGLGCFNYPMDLFKTAVQDYWVSVDNFYLVNYFMFGAPFVVFMIYYLRKVEIHDPSINCATIVMNIFAITIICYGPASSLILFGIIFSKVFATGRYVRHIQTAREVVVTHSRYQRPQSVHIRRGNDPAPDVG